MRRKLSISVHTWVLQEPFVISRETINSVEVVLVRLEEGGYTGRGEARGVSYHGETSGSMLGQLEAIRYELEGGLTRSELVNLLPPGGARNAVDAAMWDLEAKQTGVPAWRRAGVGAWKPPLTTVTIGIRSLAAYEERARALAAWPWLKVKVDARAPLAALEAVHRGAPRSRLVVDTNQAWSVDQLRELGPRLRSFNVALLEQPVPADQDEALADMEHVVPVCADEPADTTADLSRLLNRYDYVNIKLDKAGGLTSALEFAHASRAAGLRLMVGCMTGSSLAMAPALVLAQLCEIVDLDGPLLIEGDWADGLTYHRGTVSLPRPQLWG